MLQGWIRIIALCAVLIAIVPLLGELREAARPAL